MDKSVIEQAPKIIPVLTDPIGLWIQIVLAVITLFAVLVALFQEKLKSLFNQASLDLKINQQPPDCHQIDLTNSQTGQLLCKSIYIRIKISNNSKNTANNTEIMLSSFWKINKNGERKVIKHFLPMNLVWSHFQPRRTTVHIPKDLFRHCDFGYFAPLNNGKTMLKLDTMVQPNCVSGGIVPNILKPGDYEFELLLSGDNVKPQKKRWKLSFDGTWSNHEPAMLSRHIHFEEMDI